MAQPAIAHLNALLSAAFGGPVRVVATHTFEPWSVMRCTLDGGADAPGSAVVKWLRDDPLSVRIDPSQVATERAALEFLAAIGFARAPKLFAADPAAGVLVMEDLAPRTPLADQIRQRGADAMVGELIAFAETMGALGAATAGKAAAYDVVRRRCGGPDPVDEGRRGLSPYWLEGRQVLAALGRPLSRAAERDLEAAEQTLRQPGAFLTLSNGDPHPNNFMTDGRDGRLIDFEFAGFRHALTAAVWIHVPGPAWITVAHPSAAAFEAGYRRELARGVREAEDDRQFGSGLAAAALAEACDRIGRFPVLDARPHGDSGRPQRIATLEAAASVARRWDAFPDLAGWMEDTARWLRRRWPDADLDIGALPAYTQRL